MTSLLTRSQLPIARLTTLKSGANGEFSFLKVYQLDNGQIALTMRQMALAIGIHEKYARKFLRQRQEKSVIHVQLKNNGMACNLYPLSTVRDYWLYASLLGNQLAIGRLQVLAQFLNHDQKSDLATDSPVIFLSPKTQSADQLTHSIEELDELEDENTTLRPSGEPKSGQLRDSLPVQLPEVILELASERFAIFRVPDSELKDYLVVLTVDQNSKVISQVGGVPYHEVVAQVREELDLRYELDAVEQLSRWGFDKHSAQWVCTPPIFGFVLYLLPLDNYRKLQRLMQKERVKRISEENSYPTEIPEGNGSRL